MSFQLRPYQEKGVAEIREAFASKIKNVLFVLPTGGGKTYTFSYIAYKAAERGNGICIIVHRKELLLQSSKSLNVLGVDHGLISPHFTPDYSKKIQVASIDTLLIRIKKNPEKFAGMFKMLIFDEAHHVVANNKWGSLHELLGKPVSLGVTATPVRGNGQGLGDGHGGIFQTMVIGPTVRELVDMGSLVAPDVYTSLEIPDLGGLKVNKDGDYNQKELADRVDKPVITGSAVSHYQELCPGYKAIVFCVNINHAKHVVAEFNQAGYRFRLLVGAPEMSDGERTEVNRQLAAGEIDGAATVDLVSEGYDLPDLECCIMLRPTNSESLYLQQLGRIMRPSPNKRGCILLDHVGNVGQTLEGVFVRKHGFPLDVREWSLEGRKKKRGKKAAEEPKLRLIQCKRCFHIFTDGYVCPKCGHDMTPAGRELEQVEGQLVKVTPELEQAYGRQKLREVSRAKSLEELREIEARRGYKKGWADHIYKARQRKAG